MLAHVVQRADVRVIQPGDGLRFALEPRPAVRVRGDLGREDLDGNRAVEAGITGLVDLAHPAGPNGGLDLVRAEAGTGREGHRGARQIVSTECQTRCSTGGDG